MCCAVLFSSRGGTDGNPHETTRGCQSVPPRSRATGPLLWGAAVQTQAAPARAAPLLHAPWVPGYTRICPTPRSQPAGLASSPGSLVTCHHLSACGSPWWRTSSGGRTKAPPRPHCSPARPPLCARVTNPLLLPFSEHVAGTNLKPQFLGAWHVAWGFLSLLVAEFSFCFSPSLPPATDT